MNDRFKFRAWDERNKIMHYDFQFIKDWSNGGWIIFQSDKQKLDWETNEKFTVNVYPNPYFAEQLKIMQCTGLKDKNGKLIYEGDIVDEVGFTYHKVVWNDEYCCFTVEDINGNKLLDSGIEATSDDMSNHRIEVIGNIYENPELLEDTEQN